MPPSVEDSGFSINAGIRQMSYFTKGRDIITPFCFYSSVVGIWKSNRVWTGTTCFSFFESLVLPQNQVKLGLRLKAPESLEPYHSGKKKTTKQTKTIPQDLMIPILNTATHSDHCSHSGLKQEQTPTEAHLGEREGHKASFVVILAPPALTQLCMTSGDDGH